MVDKAAAKNSYHMMRGVAAVLKPEAQIFSPALGLLSITAPAVVANLRNRFLCIPEEGLVHCPGSILARELFHQRQDSAGRRYGAVAVTRSRSKAAYWLTPQSIGTLVGTAVSERVVQVRLDICFVPT